MQQYLKIEISAETKQEAEAILLALLEKKLVAGGVITVAPAKFWWKGELTDMDYFTISAFTTPDRTDSVTQVVEATSKEEVSLIWFYSISGSKKTLGWIDHSLADS